MAAPFSRPPPSPAPSACDVQSFDHPSAIPQTPPARSMTGLYEEEYGEDANQLHGGNRPPPMAMDQSVGPQDLMGSPGHYTPPQPFGTPPNSEYSSVLPMPQPTFIRTSQITTPPRSEEGVTAARNGRSLPPTSPLDAQASGASEKVRVCRSPRLRKRAKSRKTDDDGPAIIAGPLSEVTKHLSHIPIKDTDVWVNRPTDTRHQESALKRKVARPMNSFMLYRSAYTERIKALFSQGNHQMVSKVSGRSWALEPKAVRDQFDVWASIERDNHAKAYPDYKFAPNKNGTMPAKKKRPLDDDDPSDLEDPQYDLDSILRHTPKRTRDSEVESCYDSPNSTPFDSSAEFYAANPAFYQSPWAASPMARPLSAMMSPGEHMYYQPNPMRYGMEELSPREHSHSGGTYDSSAMLTGLPGNAHHDLLQGSRPSSAQGVQVDPRLLAYDDRQGAGDDGAEFPGPYSLSNGPSYLTSEAVPYPSQPALYLRPPHFGDAREAWNMLQCENQQLAGSEFDQWFNNSGY